MDDSITGCLVTFGENGTAKALNVSCLCSCLNEYEMEDCGHTECRPGCSTHLFDKSVCTE